jgi:hypothetical protein
MSEKEQKPEPTSHPEANEQSVPKIDFGVDGKQNAAPDSGQGKDTGSEKNSGGDTKPQPEKEGAPAQGPESSRKGESAKDSEAKSDAEAKRDAEEKKNAEPKKEDESSKKFQSDVEERFEKQLTVNRKLAAMLEEQLDLLLSVRQSMLAIQKTLESSAGSKKKLETALETVKDGAEGLPDVHWINRVRGTLAMLQRSGVA